MLSRVIAALVGLAVVIPALLYGGQTTVEVICALILLIGADEYARMAAPGDRGAWALLLLSSFGLYSALLWAPPEWLHGILGGLTVLIYLYGLLGVSDVDSGARTSSRLLAGLLYLPTLWTFVPKVRAFDDGLAWIFLVLTATWLGDTGAYFAGRALGRTPLFARVSPKKTWEGVVGGVVAGIGGACLVKAVALPDLPWGHAALLGALLVTAGVLGDLTESLLKRAFGVKDSGWIMPGHGGILDRVDGILFSAVTLWAYVTLLGLG